LHIHRMHDILTQPADIAIQNATVTLKEKLRRLTDKSMQMHTRDRSRISSRGGMGAQLRIACVLRRDRTCTQNTGVDAYGTPRLGFPALASGLRRVAHRVAHRVALRRRVTPRRREHWVLRRRPLAHDSRVPVHSDLTTAARRRSAWSSARRRCAGPMAAGSMTGSQASRYRSRSTSRWASGSCSHGSRPPWRARGSGCRGARRRRRRRRAS